MHALREELPLLAARLDAISPALDQHRARDRAGDRRRTACATAPRRGCARCGASTPSRASGPPSGCASSPASLRSHLQEEFLTERGGRPVLAVRADARSAVPGIVHDASGSGQTLFVEPFALVEQHNRLRELASEEREEIARILAALSGLVGAVGRRHRGRRRRARRARPRDGLGPARAAHRRLPRPAGRRRRAGRRRATRCSSRAPPCRSTCRSPASARSSSRARTPAARRSR